MSVSRVSRSFGRSNKSILVNRAIPWYMLPLGLAITLTRRTALVPWDVENSGGWAGEGHGRLVAVEHQKCWEGELSLAFAVVILQVFGLESNRNVHIL